mgnify:CR=1 FL=1
MLGSYDMTGVSPSLFCVSVLVSRIGEGVKFVRDGQAAFERMVDTRLQQAVCIIHVIDASFLFFFFSSCVKLLCAVSECHFSLFFPALFPVLSFLLDTYSVEGFPSHPRPDQQEARGLHQCWSCPSGECNEKHYLQVE